MPTFIASLKNWPLYFLGTQLGALSNGALCWRTIQNLRSRKAIPAECFVKISSRKVLIIRDPFLEWLAADMQRLAAVTN